MKKYLTLLIYLYPVTFDMGELMTLEILYEDMISKSRSSYVSGILGSM